MNTVELRLAVTPLILPYHYYYEYGHISMT